MFVRPSICLSVRPSIRMFVHTFVRSQKVLPI